jgi:hypothetical protein
VQYLSWNASSQVLSLVLADDLRINEVNPQSSP